MAQPLRFTIAFAILLSLFTSNVASLGLTDTITWGGDNSRTGYQTNHNLDPAIVGSSEFGEIFRASLPGIYNGAKEQIFSQPLVYTLSDGIQYLFVATTHNNLYKLNAATGAVVLKRNLHIPFLVTDLDGCGDINPLIGVTSTGVIDPNTDTLYLTAKTYQDQTAGPIAQGRPNGRYYFHAINVNDLSERAGFPINIEGIVASNNPLRSFNGGVQHQRPALLHTGNYIYAGFASHCVKFNYTGWVFGWDKTTGAVVESYAMEGAPVDSQTQGGGVWMSGGGLASDDAGSMFFATGNGHASQLTNIPVSGRNPPSALEEAAVHMSINSDGTLKVVDFFMPFEKRKLDGGDIDLGTSPLEILPKEFSCGNFKRIGVVTGKSGKTYWLNLDDMGGYQMAANNLDNVIQVTQNENSVYAGAGVYPGEGGYIYINVMRYPTHVFKFNCAAGVPSFTQVADSLEVCAYLGVSHGTTTSLNGQPGTGLYWVSDVNGYNLRIYNAVPVNGQLNLINHFQISSVAKFTRPVFGNGRAYIGTTAGLLYGFGTNSKPSLNCTAIEFGTVNVDASEVVKTVSCKANVALKVTGITLKSTVDFGVSQLPVFPLNVLANGVFTFQATFNPAGVGMVSSDVVIATTNGVSGYSSSTAVTLRGTGESVAPFLGVSPATLSFQGVTGEQVGGLSQTTLLVNSGNTLLSISSIDYSATSSSGPFQTITSISGTLQVGPFTFSDLPTTIAPNSVTAVTVNFATDVSGNFSSYLVIHSNGGSKALSATGISGDPPVAVVEFQTVDGLGWVRYQPGTDYTFGDVTENQIRSLKLRVTNGAPIDSASLSLAVSKPPFGNGIISATNLVDLSEGTILKPGESATATIYCAPPKKQWNTDSYVGRAQWTMNFNDPNFSHQDMQFVCNAVAEQTAPLFANGSSQYRYTGCFKENNPGRQLKKQIYGDDSNTISKCIAACVAGGYKYCGTQYHRECWGGPTIPNLQVDDANCNFACEGDLNQVCGGNGVGAGEGNGPYISLFVDSLQLDGTPPTPSVPVGGPVTNPGVGGYTSIGCYTEATDGRALPISKKITLKTVANCVSACSSSKYQYAGLEYGGQCWCGDSFTAGSVPTAITDCSTPCADNTTEYCGAGKRLNVYQFSASTPISSAISSSSFRTVLVGSSTVATISTSIFSSTSRLSSISSSVSSTLSSISPSFSSSPLSSALLSASSTFSLSSAVSVPPSSLSSTFSTELSSIISLSSISSSFTSTQSVSASHSTATSISLSSGLLSSTSEFPTASSGSLLATSSVLSTTPLPLSSSIPSRPTSSSVSLSTPSTFAYVGCYAEPDKGRALTKSYGIDKLTIEICESKCAAYNFFGLEYGRECWCGNTLNPAATVAAEEECKKPCGGNTSQRCGAGGRLNLYTKSSPASGGSTVVEKPATSSVSTIPSLSSPIPDNNESSSSKDVSVPTSLPPTPPYTGPPVTSHGNENFTYYSCISEPSSGRLLSKKVENNGDEMTIERCLSMCYMYIWAGVEYGKECWCGNMLNLAGKVGATPAANLSDSSCKLTCPGNSSEFCGARGSLNLYQLRS